MTDRRFLLSVIGVAISFYSINVDHKLSENEDASVMCDINPYSSCKSAFQSPVGTGFGFICSVTGDDHFLCQKNSVYGVFFYGLMALLSLSRNTATAELLLLMSLSSIIMSTYLSIVLFKMRNLCIVCAITHIVNVLLLLVNWKERRQIMAEVYADLEKKDQ